MSFVLLTFVLKVIRVTRASFSGFTIHGPVIVHLPFFTSTVGTVDNRDTQSIGGDSILNTKASIIVANPAYGQLYVEK